MTYMIIILVVILVISTFLLATLMNYLLDQRKVDVLTNANIVSSVVSENFTPEFVARKMPQLAREKSSRAIIVDNKATVIFDTYEENSITGKTFLKAAVTNALRGKGTDTANAYKENDDWYIEAAVPVIKNAQPIGAVYMLVSAESTLDTINHIRNSLWLIGILIIVIVGVFATTMARILMLPVEKLTHFISNMPQDSLQKTEIMSHDEIGQLAIAFNELIDRMAEMEKQREAFVSDASHELKTPLSIVKLISDSLMQTENPDPKIVREFLSDMNNEVDRLERIVERLLNLTRMKSKSLNMHFQTVDVSEVVDQVYHKLEPLARSKNITFTKRIQEGITLSAERDSLTEAVYNIADNSIKYTEPGGKVSIELTCDLSSILITVTDTGIGIPKEEVSKIFDRFYRVDKARARETGGTGLGLSIALDAIKLHNGHIEVISEEELGSKFMIVLPFDGSDLTDTKKSQ